MVARPCYGLAVRLAAGGGAFARSSDCEWALFLPESRRYRGTRFVQVIGDGHRGIILVMTACYLPVLFFCLN